MAYSALGLFVLLLVIFTTYPFIHRYVKNVFNNSFVWLGISTVWFAYALFMYIDWVWIHGILNGRGVNDPIPEPNEKFTMMDKSNYFNAFGDASFTAICNFMFMFMPLTIIFNPSKKITSLLAPIGAISGVLTLLTYSFNIEYDKHNFFYSIFWLNYGSVFKHFLLSLACFLLLFNTPKFNFIQPNRKIKISNTLIAYICIYMAYILYIILISEIEAHTIFKNHPERSFYNNMCLFINDIQYEWSQYHFLAAFKNFFWLAPTIFWFLIIGGGLGISFLFNKIKNKKMFTYVEPKYYYNKKIKISDRKWYSL